MHGIRVEIAPETSIWSIPGEWDPKGRRERGHFYLLFFIFTVHVCTVCLVCVCVCV